MKLACDVEQVASSIFRRLMFQLIHWFTKSVKTESKETMALLDTVTDAVGDPEDAALRFGRSSLVALSAVLSSFCVCPFLRGKLVLLQLIHWFMKSVKTESKETMTLLDTVTDAVGDAEDAALRFGRSSPVAFSAVLSSFLCVPFSKREVGVVAADPLVHEEREDGVEGDDGNLGHRHRCCCEVR